MNLLKFIPLRVRTEQLSNYVLVFKKYVRKGEDTL